MPPLDTHIRTYSVRDFLSWQRVGALIMNPDFQRRPHWKPGARSYLLDSMLRNYPIPPVFIRERASADDFEPRREIVDGQQRLRTIISFIAPDTLRDFKEDRDAVRISKKHFPSVANMPFDRLSSQHRSTLLDYEIATHVLPAGTDDRLVLQIFARMNSTGTRLNDQELRNAEYFGEFKTTSYSLAYEQLERWRSWNIFTSSQIARMAEVEMTSDLIGLVINGVTGKSQRSLNALYKQFEDTFPGKSEVARRFRAVMDSIDDLLGNELRTLVFSRQPLFYTLFALIYDEAFGLKSGFERKLKAKRIPHAWREKLLSISNCISSGNIPKAESDAFDKATADTGRRRRRLAFVRKEIGGG